MRLVLCDSRPRTSSPVACRRAARFGATVLALPGGRLGRPGGRAATARSAAGRSSAQLASSGKRSAPLRPRSAPRWRLLVEFVASRLRACGSPSASLPFAGRPLPPPASAKDVRCFVAAMPAPRPARPSRRVRRTASARLSPLGAWPSRPLLTQRLVLCCEAMPVARGPEEPTVAREKRRDRLSPRCSRLRKRILPRGMTCHVRLTDVWRQVRLPERRFGRSVGPTGRECGARGGFDRERKMRIIRT